MSAYRIGIDAGGTKVAYGLYDDNDNLVDRFQHATPIEADGPAFCDQVIDSVKGFIEKNNLSEADIRGIGICMPSYILFEKGYIYVTSAMVNIRDFAMRDYIKERLPIPVIMDNDANVAALAEHRFGAGRGNKNMVYVATSTGVGSGIILNNQLFRGSYGFAGESGHMLITPDSGVMCGCRNRGCFMSWISGRYIPDQVKILAEGRDTVIDLDKEINGEVLLNAFKAGDEVAIKTVEQMAYYLGVCIYNIYELLNVNLYVFGGGLTHFGAPLYDKARETFDRFNQIDLPVEWKFAEAKQDFGIIGAAELVREL